MKLSLKLSHVSAGFIAVLVGYTSSAAIIFQAATAAGATPDQISSWLWALGIGMGLSTISLSLYYRTPILTAWSTPGAALLITGLSGITLAEAVGIFLFSSLLITLVGISGGFDKIMRYVPPPLAAAMLAGILFQFGLNLFSVASTYLTLVLSMLITYLIARRLLPRYVIPLALLVGSVVASLQGLLQFESFEVQWSAPIWVTPKFSLQSLIGVGVPLFIVTMASQNLPGIAVLRTNGYKVPASPLITTTGVTGLLLAPFGGFAYNLAAITAAICMGKDAGSDRDGRYWASVSAGGFYVLAGLLGATVAGLFAALPEALVLAIAGLALLSTIGNSLAGALTDERSREASLLTFLITASGITLASISSAFWGILVGLVAYYLLSEQVKKHESEQARD